MGNEVAKTTEVTEVGRLVPAMNMDEAVTAFEEYQSLQKKLANDGDFVMFRTKNGQTACPTKQWRVKLERFFGLSVEITKDWDITENDKSTTYHKRVRVTHNKSGLFHEATGACNTKEKARDYAKMYHNAEAHAETRAKNRAVFEFVGFGEVSAEEMASNGNGDKEKDVTPKQSTAPKKQSNTSQPKEELSDKQKDFVKKHFLSSRYISDEEKASYTKEFNEGMSKARASELIFWWIGDNKKGVVGEREKREVKQVEKNMGDAGLKKQKSVKPKPKRTEKQQEIIDLVKTTGIKKPSELIKRLSGIEYTNIEGEPAKVKANTTFDDLMYEIEHVDDLYAECKRSLENQILGGDNVNGDDKNELS